MRILRWCAAILATAVATVAVGSPAQAHNSLTDAVPAKGATLKEAPAEVKLSFLQTLDERYLTIAVTDAEKKKVATEEPKADGKTGILPLPADLPNGEYTVAYRVVSEDGHPVQGSYKFTVDNPAAVPSPSTAPSSAAPVAAAPSTSSAAAPTVELAGQEESSTGWWPIAAIAAAVVLLAIGAAVLFRRRQPTDAA